jgi:succinyl-CoA synthetase beta subunit/citryl-CoA synthetase large subunit
MAKILENHTKELLAKFGIDVPAGKVASSPGEARQVADELGAPCMVKALLPKGKKGKAGLIKEAVDAESAAEIAAKLLGSIADDLIVQNVYVEKKAAIKKELFASITYDNLAHAPVLLFSPEGGVEIEELAASNPELVFKQPIDILEGFHPFQAKALCFKAGLGKSETASVSQTLVSLYQFFIQSDARLLEINPLCLTEDDGVVAVGSLLNIDDEALFRHPEFEAITSYGLERIMGDLNEREKWVLDADLAAPGSGAVRYTEFENGEIGFIVAGGGASLLAMDTVTRAGCKPANYSDLGPGKGAHEKLKVLIKAVLNNPSVEAIITGAAIATADDIGRSGSAVAKMLEEQGWDASKMPIVARWAGYNDKDAKAAWEDVPGAIYFGAEMSFEEATEKVVELVKKKKAQRGS